jgi:hypothetical protein
MTLLLTLAPSSAPLLSPPNGRGQGPAVPEVERARGLRDALRDQSRQAQGRPGGAPRPDIQDQETRRAGTRYIAPRRERDAQSQGAGPGFFDTRSSEARPGGDGFSAPFLAQVFEQDLGPPQVFIPEHRDAAIRGSEAYRQAGAAPPAYSQEPAYFRFAI